MDSAWEAYRLEVAEAGAGEGEGPNNNAVEAVGGEEVAKGKTLGSTPAGGDGFSFGAVPALPAIDATTKTRTTATTSKNRKSAIPTKNNRTSHKQKWESWLARLRAFEERQGHVNVPRGYEDKELGKFVNHQRNNYRLLLEGKQNSLTTERIQDLEKVRCFSVSYIVVIIKSVWLQCVICRGCCIFASPQISLSLHILFTF